MTLNSISFLNLAVTLSRSLVISTDALDALPSAANSVTDSNTGTVLPETSAGSSQLDKPNSCVSSSAVNLPGMVFP